MRVGIIGCGLIGTCRAKVAVDSGDEVVVVADIAADRAASVAGATRSGRTALGTEVVSRDDLDVVVVSSSNDLLAAASISALESDKRSLCEKPLARNAGEVAAIVEAAAAAGKLLRVGFNRRHHHGWDGLAAARILDAIYASAASGTVVAAPHA